MNISSIWTKVGSLLAVLALWVGLTACGESEQPNAGVELNPYTINFSADPAQPVKNQPVALKISIEGKKSLSKQADIFYEIKKTGSDEHTEVRVTDKGDRRFEGTYSFPESGFYTIVVHVTTPTAHQIANQQLEIK